MSEPRAVRTVGEIAGPYANILVAPPSGGDGVCPVCHSTVYDGYPRCRPCGEAHRKFGTSAADAVASISLAAAGLQYARELFTYKKVDVPLHVRQQMTVGLAAVLWMWLARHEQCLAARAGVDSFGIVTTVPSTSGRSSEHPLHNLVQRVGHTRDRLDDLLRPSRTQVDQRAIAADRFESIRSLDGQAVLVVDDTWTTGAHAQSASAALKRAGAGSVAVLSLGRWVVREFRNDGDFYDAVRKNKWDWNRCCLDADHGT